MSAVWAFFVVKKEDRRLAICNSCKCEVMRGGSRTKNFNTSNLISHLKFRHTEIYKDYQTKVTAKQTLPTTNKPVQQTLDKIRRNLTRTVPKQKQSIAKLWKLLQLMTSLSALLRILDFVGLFNLLNHATLFLAGGTSLTFCSPLYTMKWQLTSKCFWAKM